MLHSIGTHQRRSPLFYLFAPLSVLMISVMAINPALQLQKGIESATAVSRSEFYYSNLSVNSFDQNMSSDAGTPEARSEAFWLSRSPHQAEITPASWNFSVAAGDYIILKQGPYDQRRFEVVSVQEEQDLPTKIVTDFNSEPHYTFICRDITKKDQPLIKLSIDTDGKYVIVHEPDIKTL